MSFPELRVYPTITSWSRESPETSLACDVVVLMFKCLSLFMLVLLTVLHLIYSYFR